MTVKVGGYYPATVCAGSASSGAKALMSWQLAAMPGSTNLGIYDCRKIAGSNQLSVHASGRAGDNGTGTGQPTAVSKLHVEQLRLFSAELHIQGLIHNRRAWWSNYGRHWLVYSGTDPHTNHIHSELDLVGGTDLTVDVCNRALFGDAPSRPSVERPLIGKGAKGATVVYAQHRLNEHGWGLAEDGDYGPLTFGAVQAFQRAVRIGVDGVIGRQTWGRLGEN